MASGSGTLDFGAFPGSSYAETVVTGQTLLLAGSLVEAWLDATAATADHSEDEHVVVPIQVRVKAKVAGTGFTICGYLDDPGVDFPPDQLARHQSGAIGALGSEGPSNTPLLAEPRCARVYGLWSIAWAGNY